MSGQGMKDVPGKRREYAEMTRVRLTQWTTALVVTALAALPAAAVQVTIDPFNDDGMVGFTESVDNVRMREFPLIGMAKLVDGPDTPTMANELLGTRDAMLSISPPAMMDDGRAVLVFTGPNIGLGSDALNINIDENHSATVMITYSDIMDGMGGMGVDLSDGGTNAGFLTLISSDPSASGTDFTVELTTAMGTHVGTFFDFMHPDPFFFIDFDDFAPAYPDGTLVTDVKITIATDLGSDLAIDLFAGGNIPGVPEPMTASLGLMGLAVLAARRRRRVT